VIYPTKVAGTAPLNATERHAPENISSSASRSALAAGNSKPGEPNRKNLDEESRRRYGKPFAAAGREQQIGIVAFMARGEANPQSEIERFFVLAKRMAVDGYLLSEEGQRDWPGVDSGAHSEFTGCDHPEHLPRLRLNEILETTSWGRIIDRLNAE
jgi:hypothetical protein